MRASIRRAVLALPILVVTACCQAQSRQPASSPPPAADSGDALEMSFEEFAASKGVEAPVLAAELGLAEGADFSTPAGELLAAHGLSRPDLQRAMQTLAPGPGARDGEGPPAAGSRGALTDLSPSAAMAMPFREFAQTKGVDPQELAEALGLPASTDLQQSLESLLSAHDLGQSDVQAAVMKLNPIAAEAAHKDWRKIRLKFVLWAAFFLAAMLILSLTKVTRPLRVGMLVAAVLVFGVWLGVEPNAPGTVKDGLVLYGAEGVIFRPRLIAFIGFLLMSIIGNKVFCGWGCHFGTLQDLAWQPKTKKYKPAFWVSNTVRIGFLAAVAAAALGLGADIMEPVDPFRIFRFSAATAVAVAALILVAGVWIYRPWCTFFCPFGLVSWVGERVSIWRPRVNHDTCIDCKACERACPTHSMEGNRARRRLYQDCFACGACVRTCPVSAVKWAIRPPLPTTAKDNTPP